MTHHDAAPGDMAVLAQAFPAEWREPALGWEPLWAWEAEHGVELPEPYRSFVAEVANGSSAGPPDDGLLPLGWLPDDFPFQERDPAALFPLTTTWFWEEDPDAGKARIDAAFTDGSVVLGVSDGPMYWLLVVSGPQRGKVWAASEVGVVALGDDGDGVGFGEWVTGWAADPDEFFRSFVTD